eukprot:5166063-Pleurochrysis_carterae.AAC.1
MEWARQESRMGVARQGSSSRTTESDVWQDQETRMMVDSCRHGRADTPRFLEIVGERRTEAGQKRDSTWQISAGVADGETGGRRSQGGRLPRGEGPV